MISKELLSEVLRDKITTINIDYNNVWYDEIYCINIYEFTHKCKEWAYSYGYTILSSVDECYLIDREGNGLVFEQTYISELKAIFKACQWILDNKDK